MVLVNCWCNYIYGRWSLITVIVLCSCNNASLRSFVSPDVFGASYIGLAKWRKDVYGCLFACLVCLSVCLFVVSCRLFRCSAVWPRACSMTKLSWVETITIIMNDASLKSLMTTARKPSCTNGCLCWFSPECINASYTVNILFSSFWVTICNHITFCVDLDCLLTWLIRKRGTVMLH